jgi:hypothetical protein
MHSCNIPKHESEKNLHNLKMPKGEIFLTKLYTLNDPIWEGDLGTNTQQSVKIVKRLLRHLLLSHRQKLFAASESSAKNISSGLIH